MSSMLPSEDSHPGTRLESFDEIREAAPGARRTPTVKEAAKSDDVPYRPVRRPPMALLCAFDDGRDDGEWFRLRSERIVLGRTEGDVRIPHDEMMSGRHTELFRQISNERFRWYLRDLGSTNGTYVRINTTQVRNGQEFLIGTRRFRFSSGRQVDPAATQEEAAEANKGTRGWQSVSVAELLPSVVELTPRGEGQRSYLNKSEHFLGRDAGQCDILLSDDLMVSARHARLHRDAKGRWLLENCGAGNGVWLRIDKIAIDNSAQFQLGEQRFLIKVL
jgi:pSer/pThr/pTyr-binding forkhead associated (FHA) protein